MKQLAGTLVLLLACAISADAAEVVNDVLKTLHRDHPRLYRTREGFDNLKKALDEDPVLYRWYEKVLEHFEDFHGSAPFWKMYGGEQPRNITHRILTASGLFLLDGDPEKLERAKEEIFAVVAFDNWNTGFDLAKSEITFAVAVGYDWLYDHLTPEERATIRQAIIDKSLRDADDHYRRRLRWVPRVNNWNQVCNSGALVGALAIAEDEPELARRIIEGSRKSIENSMKSYAPDGGWNEGPVYWWYGTDHFVRYIAALESALGTDLGCKLAPGFSETGLFPIYTTSPSGRVFNFADSNLRLWHSPHMYWLARQFHRPEYAAFEWKHFGNDPEILDLIYSNDSAPLTKGKPLSLDHLFRGIEVACFRSAWEDPRALYVGFKGSSTHNNGHSMLDAGSFVLDWQGERFAIDLGPEKYQVPGYFSRNRWNIFRANNHSHNTLTINGDIQNPRANAPIVAYESKPDEAFAITDLSAVYKLPENSLYRGIFISNRRDVLIQDDFRTDNSLDVIWNFYTQAKIEIAGNRATLRQRGQQLNVQILEPDGAKFEIADAKAPEGQREQPDVQSLRITLKTAPGASRIVVLVSPEQNAPVPAISPLADWIARSPVKR